MNTHGLPVCPRERLTSTTTRQAMKACGDSLVGRGELSAQIFVPNQPAFRVRANLLTFNGRTKGGQPAVWAHAYSMDPPTSFVIPFTVRNEKQPDRSGDDDQTLGRALAARGELCGPGLADRSTTRVAKRAISTPPARCRRASRPGFLSFARATYSFAGGEKIVTESVRSCRVR